MSRSPSLTLRLAALFGLLIALLLAVFGGALYVASERHFREQDAHDLHGRAQIVANLAARYQDRALRDALDQVLVSHHELAVVLFGPGGEVLYSRDPAVFMAAGAAPAGPPNEHAGHEGGLQSFTVDGHHWHARISARWIAFGPRPRRLRMPSRCIRHDWSLPVMYSASPYDS